MSRRLRSAAGMTIPCEAIDILAHRRPEVLLCEQFQGFGTSWVTPGGHDGPAVVEAEAVHDLPHRCNLGRPTCRPLPCSRLAVSPCIAWRCPEVIPVFDPGTGPLSRPPRVRWISIRHRERRLPITGCRSWYSRRQRYAQSVLALTGVTIPEACWQLPCRRRRTGGRTDGNVRACARRTPVQLRHLSASFRRVPRLPCACVPSDAPRGCRAGSYLLSTATWVDRPRGARSCEGGYTARAAGTTDWNDTAWIRGNAASVSGGRREAGGETVLTRMQNIESCPITTETETSQATRERKRKRFVRGHVVGLLEKDGSRYCVISEYVRERRPNKRKS